MAAMKLRARPSPNCNERLRPVSMLVLHYTGMESAEGALERLCDPAAEVSSHYLVAEDGTVWALVPEEKRAWHAGASFWRGETDVNSASVGIEIVNPGHEFGYRAFPAAQMDAVEALCRAILARHAIAAWNVVGHSDVAPRRKEDPGELFDWRRLARAGIGLFPPPLPGGTADAAAALARIGYETADLAKTVTAFQRRWRPARLDGALDAETTAMLAAVAAAVPPWERLS
jgi:N-acetylmuramoyl-L-alanine amidase